MQEEGVKKKWEENSVFGSMESVRGKVSASLLIKKNIVYEHVEIMCNPRQYDATQTKKMDISTEQCMENVQTIPIKNLSAGSEITALCADEHCHESRQLFDKAVLVT